MHSSKKKTKTHALLLLPLVALLVILTIANLLRRDTEYSEVEKRSLAQRPSVSVASLWEGGFFTSADTWFSDQFPLRDLWIRMNYRTHALRGNKEFDDVLVGKYNTLYQMPVTPNEEALARTTEAIRGFTEANPDLTQTFFLVPDAAASQPQEVPSGAPVRDQNADIHAFLADLPASINAPDLSIPLTASSAERFYYRTDHHWTSEGAFRVFRDTAEILGIPELPAYTCYTLTNDFRGTLSARSGNHSLTDTITIFVPETDTAVLMRIPDTEEKSTSLYQEEALQGGDPYTVFLGGNHPVVHISSTNSNGRNLLILKDSYANSFVPFLAPYFETITMVDPRYYYDDLSLLIQQQQINEVLYLYSADTLFEDTSLATVLSP